MIREQWGGDEWQEYCRALLALKYETEIVFVPDRDKGDGGLEAYCFDGVGFQCYAPEEPFNVEMQTAAQKRKVNGDTAKLTSRGAATARLLGDVKLRRWVLLTPEYDSKTLIEYARKKSAEIRANEAANFWRGVDFEIGISSDELFARERAMWADTHPLSIELSVPWADEDEIFAATDSGIAETLTTKLQVEPEFAVSPRRLASYRSSLLGDYVRGQRQMTQLQTQYSALHERVQARLRSTLRGLDRQLAGTEGRGPVVIETVLRHLAESLKNDASSLSDILCEELARYAVAQWFVDCPLYFPEST